jgi:pimeloyl-ACP methyl ester carboxylesterase
MSAVARPFPPVEGVSHRFVDVRGIRLHVAEAGPTEAPAVVLLHGWPQHWYEWRALVPPLAEEYRVICPDLRGFGWSEAPPGGYGMEELARDVLALFDALELRDVRLGGHDWGGWVGFLVCLFAPERVRAYVALNIAPPFAALTPAAAANQWRLWYQWALAAPVLGPRAVASVAKRDGALRRWLGIGPRTWSDAELHAFLDQLDEPERVRASVQLYRTFQYRDLPAALGGRYRRLAPMRPPLLMLYGTGDHIVRPAHLAGLERFAPRSSIEYVASGHFVVDERPHLVIDRMRAFFAEN